MSQGGLEVEGISKRFGGALAVADISLRVPAGAFLTLLGPSGCGKTTLLRMLAGLELPDSGLIRLGGRTVFSEREGCFVPPGDRGVGLVFQSYALWPHMTVFENMAFGLRVRRQDRATIAESVRRALAYMQLDGLEGRYPQELSGGQQQRVALARMLVARPKVFLMDEPLSNLDARLRMDMRGELKRIHRDAGSTTVYVTHDQGEALTLATHVAVMRAGRIEQMGSPREIYRRPASLFVADFVGSPGINRIPGRLVADGEGVVLETAAGRFSTTAPPTLGGHEVVGAVRPEDLELTEPVGGHRVEVFAVLPGGGETVIQIVLGDLRWQVKTTKEIDWDPGTVRGLSVPPHALLLYDRGSERLVHPGPAGREVEAHD
ncbi:MAG TPA: ABC transporter ATP-binding protein [Candidatus Methylomirabilis sp.]|nr:ABC transporter ATP-binding protein [Candidatus Methylomirabilis sp.]